MDTKFINKSICFLGDSITEHGHYLYDIRSYFHNKPEKVFVHNCGTGGNRAIMAQYILDKEIEVYNPDFVVISFGVNDMGVWLYDSNKTVTERLLEKRKARDDEYYLGISTAIDMIKERGITPVIMSPFSVNEFLVEKEGIETLADNNEKEDYIGPSFYKRATFRNINNALENYSKNLKDMAEYAGALYIPLFESSKKYLTPNNDLFNADGVHCSMAGHELIAKTVLNFLGCEVDSSLSEKSDLNDEIAKWEKIERRAGSLKRGSFNPMYGKFDEERVISRAKELLKAPEEWRKEVGKYYLEYGNKTNELREKLVRLIKNF